MAKCGCSPTCSCVIQTGSCMTITGSGDPATPYIVNVTVDNQTMFCTPNGLEARLNTVDTNTVDLEGNGTVATPLEAHVIRTPDGSVPDPDALGTGNLVKEIAGPGGGIYVSCEDIQDCVGAAVTQLAVSDCLEYDDATNTISVLICGELNGLECAAAGVVPGCPAGGLSVIPSSDAGNGLNFGTDNRLLFQSPAILPGNCLIITGAGTTGNPFVITPQVAPELNGLECVPGVGLTVIPSGDPNNGLVFGTDNRLFVDNCPFIVGASQLLIGNSGPCFELQGDGCNTPLVATMRISSFPCNGLQCRGDGLYVEADTSPLPDVVTRTDDTPGFPGLGPFNGTNANLVVDGPVCITITNPSTCRNMVTTGNIRGFTDVGRINGAMEARFEVSNNPGGPWTIVHRNGQAEPNPASRATQNAAWEGDDILIPPGGSRQICARTTVSFQAAQTGRVFFSERTLFLVGKWAV